MWNAIEPASPGAVLDINAAYVFPPEEPGKAVRPNQNFALSSVPFAIISSSLPASRCAFSPVSLSPCIAAYSPD